MVLYGRPAISAPALRHRREYAKAEKPTTGDDFRLKGRDVGGDLTQTSCELASISAEVSCSDI